jgi:trehalose/maltose hydrolase-like predicted phosphorylase
MRRLGTLLVLLLVVGCGNKSATTSPATSGKPVPAPPPLKADPWVLATNDPNDPEPALLWNGLIGVRIGRNGTGLGQDGKPLPYFAIEAYDTAGEEKIQALPNPLAARWTAGKSSVPLDPARGSNFNQSLDMREGSLKTSWRQDVDGQMLEVHVETVLDPTARVLGQRWSLTASTSTIVQASWGLGSGGPSVSPKANPQKDHLVHSAILDFAPARISGRFAGRINEELRPEIPNAGILPPWRTAEKSIRLSAAADRNKPLLVEAVVSIKDDKSTTSAPPPSLTFDQLKQGSAQAWAARWKTDIEIDGPVEDQQAVRSFLFYLRSAIHPQSPMAVSPMGLSSTQYNGHVFWDADIWVFPALALLAPDEARQILDYRIAKAPMARKNFDEWVKAGRPTGSGKVDAAKSPSSGGPDQIDRGLRFPWESSVTGRETVPGPSQHQHHITGSVLWALAQGADVGLVDRNTVDTLGREGAAFYLARAERDPSGYLNIRGTMSPDENHIGDNDLYTNILAEWTLTRFIPGADWTFKGFKLPRDKKSLLTYDNDPIRGYKQAAAVLSIYPLQHAEAERQATVMMERFSDKATKNGPAMTDSVHATIWARNGQPEKAYEAWRASWQPFTDHPLLLFSEKRHKPLTYFTTGAGGSLQSVLFGFLGFRIDSKEELSKAGTPAAWSKQLQGESWLSVRPNLPREWKSVKLKNFTVLGKRYSLSVTAGAAPDTPRVTVTQGD